MRAATGYRPKSEIYGKRLLGAKHGVGGGCTWCWPKRYPPSAAPAFPMDDSFMVVDDDATLLGNIPNGMRAIRSPTTWKEGPYVVQAQAVLPRGGAGGSGDAVDLLLRREARQRRRPKPAGLRGGGAR